MAYMIRTEGRRFPILHVEPVLSDGERTHGHGPFSADRELIEELVSLCIARCHASGCRDPRGRMVDTWRIRTQIVARDLKPITVALTSYLSDLDDQPLRAFVKHPPDLRARPQPGESLDHVPA